MDHQENELIRTAKSRAYNKGYLDGYRRGIEDSRSGIVDTHIAPDLLDKPLQFLSLSTRPFNSLDRAGFRTIRDIAALHKEDIWKIRNLGSKGLHEIAWALWEHGIRDTEWNDWLYSD